jgi:LPS-assembly protein
MQKILLFLLWALVPAAALAQADPAYLIADRVFLKDKGILIAEGAVEVWQNDTRLLATRVVYDRTADRLEITGPMRLEDGEGLVLIAAEADLSADFRTGLLRGVRMIMDDQLQLAAADARRNQDGFTQLRSVVASSCQVCEQGSPPVWEIRARSVLHDHEAQQLYFEHAQLRVMDTPVFYLPRLRLPDPSLKRARGFLIPQLDSSTLLGFGIKLPYFIPMGDHADLTLTPYLSPVTSTLQMRLRRAFLNGDIRVEGAISKDSLEEKARGFLDATGQFDLRDHMHLNFDLQMVSDDAYLSEYDFSKSDRLESGIALTRILDKNFSQAEITHFESLRDSENNATQPTFLGRLEHRTSTSGPRGLGTLRYSALATGFYRTSDENVDGRDMWRLHADAAWLGQKTVGQGLRFGWTLGVSAERIMTRQDDTVPDLVNQITPAAGVTLRWPLIRTSQTGARHLVEPVAQLGWTGGTRNETVSDESIIQEFDEGNLLSLSRFPATDRYERGAQAVTGVRWSRYDALGWSSSLTLGRVWRNESNNAFTQTSGLRGTRSDWLVATKYSNTQGLSLAARGLFDGLTSAKSAEARATWATENASMDASYVLEIADPDENRSVTQSEWSISGAYDVTRNWTASTNWRYDLSADEVALAGFGLDYRNECVDVGFSVSRRFTSSSTVDPSTRFGLTVTLKGFSTGGQASPDLRTCRP